ncbi:MAG: O-antigen ligase family protein [Cellvibrionaceae bacterium]
MGPVLTAYIIIIGCLFLGGLACCFGFDRKVVIKITVLWMALTTVAIFTNMAVLAAVIIMYAVYIKDQPPEAKVFLYVACMPALPLQGFLVPFPGLNYLFELSYLRVVVVALFLPLFFQAFSKPASQGGGFRSSDFYFLCFIILTGLMTYRLGSFTTMVRELVNVMVDFGIPYFVISRYVVSSQSLSWLFCGFLVSAAFLSFFAIIESLMWWRFFSEILFSLQVQYDPVALVPYSRSGIIRTGGGPMFQTLGFAHFISMAIVTCFFFWKKKILRFFPAMILMGLYTLALTFTDSKGGILAVLLGILIIYYFSFHKTIKFLTNIAAVIVVPAAVGYFAMFGFSQLEDDHDSFGYRYQLILNSLDAISQNPILGSIDFWNNQSLANSLQGEGIIDVTNLYLQVILQYGFVGLFLYLMIFFSLIKGVLKKRNVVGFDHKGLILPLVGMTMFFIVTCSDISFVPFYITFLWAISRAYIGFQEQRLQNTAPAYAN